MSVGKGWCSRFHTPVCSYKFHALTVYLHSTFTVSHFIWGEAFLQKQSTSQALGYFCRRAPSCIFDKMSDRILNAALPNNSLQLEEGLRRSFSGVMQRNLGLPLPSNSLDLYQDHKFHAPTATEHKYDKTTIENWPPTGMELRSSRMVINGCNHYAQLLQLLLRKVIIFYIPIHKVLEQL